MVDLDGHLHPVGVLPGVLSVAVQVETGAGGARSLTAYRTADEDITACQRRCGPRCPST
ncbi:hypothetical protein [Micromonospora sp. NPDC023633]|uniref:hypothetical protein n=1 Tax=Micromonospora sp. NPDC023633 TaxID=3154320 RepID=UPI0033E8DC25